MISVSHHYWQHRRSESDGFHSYVFRESRIEARGLQKAVFLEGFKDNIHEHTRNARMFVLSSDYEGMSNALMEAMMMGLPCISTNCTGSDE